MAFTPLVFTVKCLMEWNTNKISDHNRAELSVDTQRIETPTRMANGTMRKYVIADKRTFSTSWEDLPHSSDFTVDGFWGGREIETFFKANSGPFNLKLNYGDGTFEIISVVFSSNLNKSIKKRGVYEFWDISVDMVEV